MSLDVSTAEMLKSIRDIKYGTLNESSLIDKKSLLYEFAHSKKDDDSKDDDSKDDDSKDDDSKESVPYAHNDNIYTTSIESTKVFNAKYDTKSPLRYYPDDDNVVLIGKIPSMSDASFEFRYKDKSGLGCYLHIPDRLQLSNDNIATLTKILGVFKNWQKDLDGVQDLKPLSTGKK